MLAVTAVLISVPPLQAQDTGDADQPPEVKAQYTVSPWEAGDADLAATQSAQGGTIPMSNCQIPSTRDGANATRSITIVGNCPNSGSGSDVTVDTVVVPVKLIAKNAFSNGKVVFDPTALDNNIGVQDRRDCNTGRSPVDRLLLSPLMSNVSNLTINGVNVGSAQWPNGFRLAEFWNIPRLTSSRSQTILKVTTAPAVTIDAYAHSIGFMAFCAPFKFQPNDPFFAVVSYKWLDNYIRTTLIPQLQADRIIKPTQFVVFLFRDVFQSPTDNLISNCCILGYHGASGTPAQTFAVVEWDTYFRTGSFITYDAEVSSHEIAEWMDDPLGFNWSPDWGSVGQVNYCVWGSKNVLSATLEVGDPLTGTRMPVFNFNGYPYHIQELAFAPWFFNAHGDNAHNYGAGGKFSSNGSFKGPARPCSLGGGSYTTP
jgi:hypothetical protein